MKRFVWMLCAAAIVLSLVGCTTIPLNTETDAFETATVTAEAETTEEGKKVHPDSVIPEGEITLPQGAFSAGYARVDVSPDLLPIPTYDTQVGTWVHDPIQLTCTAVCDGETVALFLSLDIRGVPRSLVEQANKIIEKTVGVPSDHVFLNATHTHSAPDNAKLDNFYVIQWTKIFYQRLRVVVKRAMLDLTPTEAYVGSSNTEGVTFVRRYLLADGTYKFNPSAADRPVAHESEADTQMRVIRFDREGDKKDIVMVNYQTHYGSATNLYPNAVSADYVHNFREAAESELGVHFAYHQGAAGNLNFVSMIPGERKYPTYPEAIPEFVRTLKDALNTSEKAELGKITATFEIYKARGWDRNGLYPQNAGTTVDVPFGAIAFGDIGFVSSPYEMFDTNGVELRAASPYKMTFNCSYTGGHMGYCPSALAYPHGAYEVTASPFAPGSGEEFVAELVRLLNVCKRLSQPK